MDVTKSGRKQYTTNKFIQVYEDTNFILTAIVHVKVILILLFLPRCCEL